MDPTQTTQQEAGPSTTPESNIFGTDLTPPEARQEQQAPPLQEQHTPQKATTPVPPVAQPAQPAQQAALTPEAIAAAVRAALPQQSQSAPQQQQQLSPAQYQAALREHFGVRDVAQVDYDVIMNGGNEAVAKFNEILQANLRSAALMAQHTSQQAVKQAMAEVQQTIAPVLQSHQQTVRQSLYQEFAKTYPELKDYETVVNLVADNLRSQGKQFPDKQEAFKFVAATVKELVRLQPTQQTQQPQTIQRTTPAAVASGGQSAGGAFRAATATSDKVTPKMLFGNAET